MNPKYWISIAALLGGLAAVAGSIGAHVIPRSPADAARIFETGQLYHALHALALLAVATVMLATEARRAAWAGYGLQVSAIAFTLGILCFSGGIYVQIAQGFSSSGGIVPFGGVCFIAGWLALAVSAFGLRTSSR